VTGAIGAAGTGLRDGRSGPSGDADNRTVPKNLVLPVRNLGEYAAKVMLLSVSFAI